MTVATSSKLWKLIYQKCNSALLPGSSKASCYRFVVDGHFIGLIRPDILDWLLKYPEVFTLKSNPSNEREDVTIQHSLSTVEERTLAVYTVMRDLRCKSVLKALDGWRNEEYGVYIGERNRTLFRLERSAASLFGVVRYGVHINGYCVQHSANNCSTQAGLQSFSDPLENCEYFHGGDNSNLSQQHPSTIFMWLGKRSLNKPTWPGLLDNMAAGGLTYGLDILECARKECQEEANVPQHLLDSLKPVGHLSYIQENERGISPQVEYCYDLLLPMNFIPHAIDGEVESFQLVTVEQVKELIFSDNFKPNSALVVLDFLRRHNLLDQSSGWDYPEMYSMMTVKFEFD